MLLMFTDRFFEITINIHFKKPSLDGIMKYCQNELYLKFAL